MCACPQRAPGGPPCGPERSKPPSADLVALHLCDTAKTHQVARQLDRLGGLELGELHHGPASVERRLHVHDRFGVLLGVQRDADLGATRRGEEVHRSHVHVVALAACEAPLVLRAPMALGWDVHRVISLLPRTSSVRRRRKQVSVLRQGASTARTGSSSRPGRTEKTTAAVSVIPIPTPTPLGTSYVEAPAVSPGRKSSISQRA